MIIYKITNSINGKVYIGLTTVTLEARWRGHIRDSRVCVIDTYIGLCVNMVLRTLL